MAVYLNTGTPGAGKTLFTLWTVEQRRLNDNKEYHDKWVAQGSDADNLPLERDVYYFNINVKNLPWIRLEKPEDWLDKPIGSIFVFDECQEAFPPRANSSTPPKYVAELAKARHQGYDLYFVTQHPTFVDPYIRKLAEEHNHLMRPYGAKRAVVHTWKGVKDNCDKSRKDSLTSSFAYPKEVYSWYKSAEVHTHKFKLPTKIKLLLLIPLFLAACVYGVVSYFNKKLEPPKPLVQTLNTKTTPGTISSGSVKQAFDPASFKTRIDDIPWSAPRYDDLTQPTVAPRIAGCFAFKNECKCITQQGTSYQTSKKFCLIAIKNGIFQDFEDGSGGGGRRETSSKQEPQTARNEPLKPLPSSVQEKTAHVDSGFNLPVPTVQQKYDNRYTSQPSGGIYAKALPDSKVISGNQ
jgi:zona occludens toxin